jgi:ComF family protein
MNCTTLLRNAAGFFFPRLCLTCRSPLGDAHWLCDACDTKLRETNVERDACPCCAENFNLRVCACGTSMAIAYPFESMVSLFDFDPPVRTIVHEIKYGGSKRLGYAMGMRYYALIPPEFLATMHAVVPVPLHRIRRMQRGYNQAEYIARGIIAGCNGLEYLPDVLVRKRWTKSQTKLTKERRRENMDGAFRVPPSKRDMLHDKNIILVDDVVTTGATVSACAQALVDAGCGVVRVLSLARD